MDVINKAIRIASEEVIKDGEFNLGELKSTVLRQLEEDEVPIRFIIIKSDELGYDCEIDVLRVNKTIDIFSCHPRNAENVREFNIALMIPTGIGCEIGGHAGDANVVANLFASSCDYLITHPNVVNAANYNESPKNVLYVEGSVFTGFLMGQCGLQPVRKNKLLLLVDKHEIPFFNEEVINAASTARMMFGLDCTVHIMSERVASTFTWSQSGRAAGKIEYLERLFQEIEKYLPGHDAIALSTGIMMPLENYRVYFKTNEMPVNPVGGIEAMLTHTITSRFRLPCAHAPLISKELEGMHLGITDPRKSAESNSVADIYCVLKGLHKSPKIVEPPHGLTSRDVSCLIIPTKCVSLPVLAAFSQGIPVIAVAENDNIMQNNFDHFPFRNKRLFIAANYWEALGLTQCIKLGIDPYTVRRPVTHTLIV